MLLDASAVFLAPLAVACISSVAVMNLKTFEPPVSLVDQKDPALWWETSGQWLGIPEAEIVVNPYLSIGMHGCGTWRTLRRFGSVQSVTRWDTVLNQPIHDTVGNEYIKVMASAHASLVTTNINNENNKDKDDKESHLYLGLGAGTLPMLMSSKHAIAIELDPAVAEAAVEYCGLKTSPLQILIGDALHHAKLVATNPNDGVLIANFHRGSAAENQRLKLGRQAYTQVFGQCLSITCRFQGNVILVAVKDKNKDIDSLKLLLDVDQAQRLGQDRQWSFDPASRVQKMQRERTDELSVGSGGYVDDDFKQPQQKHPTALPEPFRMIQALWSQ